MNRYVCWWKGQDDEPGETPHTSHVVEGLGIEWAAEEYAEKRYYDCGEHVDDMTVMVRDATGAEHEVVVTVEFSPTFSGSIR